MKVLITAARAAKVLTHVRGVLKGFTCLTENTEVSGTKSLAGLRDEFPADGPLSPSKMCFHTFASLSRSGAHHSSPAGSESFSYSQNICEKLFS